MSHEIKGLESSVLNLHVLLNELNDLHVSMRIKDVSNEIESPILEYDKPTSVNNSFGKLNMVEEKKVLMDAYGKHYTAIEDLIRARGKQMTELYENIDGMRVCGFDLIVEIASRW
jgi:hypothetical protein